MDEHRGYEKDPIAANSSRNSRKQDICAAARIALQCCPVLSHL